MSEDVQETRDAVDKSRGLVRARLCDLKYRGETGL
jgi:hypothetical protein